MGYKLHYYDCRYYAEPARMMFHAAGVEFEDITFTQAEWNAGINKTAPTGKAPWLEVDGHTIFESSAINRFLAKRFGFNGQDEFEEALIDSTAHFLRNYMDDIFDYLCLLAGWFQGDVDKYFEEKGGPALEAVINSVKQRLHESSSGFIVKSGPTWMDLVLAEHIIRWVDIIPKFAENHPDVVAYKERVHNHKKFKQYADTRKDYPSGYLARSLKKKD